MPSIRCSWLPSTIVQVSCPGSGQLHVSPTRATGFPPTMNCWVRTVETWPPWEVGSPRRMTLGMAFPFQRVAERHDVCTRPVLFKATISICDCGYKSVVKSHQVIDSAAIKFSLRFTTASSHTGDCRDLSLPAGSSKRYRAPGLIFPAQVGPG